MGDSIRDVALIPVAFIAALYGIVFGGDEPDRYFRRLMRFGRKTDRFINLFGQHNDNAATDADKTPLIDELLEPYERQLLDGIIKNTKSTPPTHPPTHPTTQPTRHSPSPRR